MGIKIDLETIKQLKRFLVAGFSAVAVDMTVYYLLMGMLDKSLAKGISFLSGTFVAFFINKFWTFEKKSLDVIEVLKFSLLYTSTLIANITVNKAVLIIIPNALLIGFLCATGTSTVLNFIGQKWWVFKERNANI